MTLMLPTHLVGRVRWQNEKLALDWLSMNWLSERLKENPDLVAHQTPDDRPLVLTGSTADLQAFLRQHANTDEAWEATLLTRLPSAASD